MTLTWPLVSIVIHGSLILDRDSLFTNVVLCDMSYYTPGDVSRRGQDLLSLFLISLLYLSLV